MTETNKIQGLFPFSIPAIYCCSQPFLEANMCVCFVHCFTPILIDVSISPCRNLLKSMRPYLTVSICCSTQKWKRRKQSSRWQWNEWRNWPCDIKKNPKNQGIHWCYKIRNPLSTSEISDITTSTLNVAELSAWWSLEFLYTEEFFPRENFVLIHI